VLAIAPETISAIGQLRHLTAVGVQNPSTKQQTTIAVVELPVAEAKPVNAKARAVEGDRYLAG
jgi:hypothetical protein